METATGCAGSRWSGYAETFRDNAIDVTVLPELSESDLEKLGDAPSADRTLQAVLVESYLVETCGV